MKSKQKPQINVKGGKKKTIADILTIRREISVYNAAKRRENGILG